MSEKRSGLFSRMERAYAKALFDLATSAGQLDAVAQEVSELRRFVTDTPDIVKLLSSRIIPMHGRLDSARKIFEGKVSDLMLRFVLVLVQRDRFDELSGVADAFVQLVEQEHGEVEVDAYGASAIDDESQRRITERVGGVLNRKILLRTHVDEKLIGGLKLRVADEIYDGSVATQLEIIKQKLINQGRAKAREQAAQI
ncbi:MAG: ATP synthase F1 subunit delta [Phycisphaera sp.]|nr:ATP synthase F1 subunit delta [Phycisphaera sp.]